MLHPRFSSLQNRRGPLAEINVVPYIDVMLVLLVIFMVTTPLLSQGVKVNLPQAQAQTMTQSQEPLIVSINHEGQLYLNTAVHPDIPVTETELTQQVAEQLHLAEQRKMKRQVFIKADKEVNYGKVVNAMVLLQKVGAVNIGLVTESADKHSM